MNRLKILHVIDSDGVYGAERVVLELSRECARRGFGVCIATLVSSLAQRDALGEEAAQRGISHIPIEMRCRADLGSVKRLRSIATAQGFDLIQSHGYRANILLAVTQGGYSGCPVIGTLHGSTAAHWFRLVSLYGEMERRLLWRLDHIITVSRRIRDGLSSANRDSRVSVIANGIRLPTWDCVKRQFGPTAIERGVSSWPKITSVGRLSHEKGFDILLPAFAKVLDRMPSASLRIAGDGPLRGMLQHQAVGLGISGRVEFVGYVNDVPALLLDSDLFVLTSRTEGLPLALLEAMACGVPVISTSVGDIPDVLENGSLGVLLRSHSVEDVADAILTTIENPSAANLRAVLAAKKVRACYTVSMMAEQYIEVYRAVLRRTRA